MYIYVCIYAYVCFCIYITLMIPYDIYLKHVKDILYIHICS